MLRKATALFMGFSDSAIEKYGTDKNMFCPYTRKISRKELPRTFNDVNPCKREKSEDEKFSGKELIESSFQYQKNWCYRKKPKKLETQEKLQKIASI